MTIIIWVWQEQKYDIIIIFTVILSSTKYIFSSLDGLKKDNKPKCFKTLKKRDMFVLWNYWNWRLTTKNGFSLLNTN